MELIFILAALIFTVTVWWVYSRWFRVFSFNEGVKENVNYILKKLDYTGISYRVKLPTDFSAMMNRPMDVGGGVAINVTQHTEMSIAYIRVYVMVGDREVRKTVFFNGSNVPAPNITISISPLHCWGFDPHALTSYSRDPKFSEARYVQTPVYPDLESQILPDEILNIAANFLIWPVPENLIDMYWDDMHTERDRSDEEYDDE